jgi:hypothetical protein
MFANAAPDDTSDIAAGAGLVILALPAFALLAGTIAAAAGVGALARRIRQQVVARSRQGTTTS